MHILLAQAATDPLSEFVHFIATLEPGQVSAIVLIIGVAVFFLVARAFTRQSAAQTDAFKDSAAQQAQAFKDVAASYDRQISAQQQSTETLTKFIEAQTKHIEAQTAAMDSITRETAASTRAVAALSEDVSEVRGVGDKTLSATEAIGAQMAYTANAVQETKHIVEVGFMETKQGITSVGTTASDTRAVLEQLSALVGALTEEVKALRSQGAAVEQLASLATAVRALTDEVKALRSAQGASSVSPA